MIHSRILLWIIGTPDDDVMKISQFDAEFPKRAFNPAIAQSTHFTAPLVAVHGVQLVIKARVTSKFCCTERQLRKNADEGSYFQQFGQRIALGHLTVKIATVVDA